MLRHSLLMVLCFFATASALVSAKSDRISAIAYDQSAQLAQNQALASLMAKLNDSANLYQCQHDAIKKSEDKCLGGFFYFDMAIEAISFKSAESKQGLSGYVASIDKAQVEERYTQQLSELNKKLKTSLSVARKTPTSELTKSIWQQSQLHQNIETLLGIFGIDHGFQLTRETIEEVTALQLRFAPTISTLTDIPDYLSQLGAVEKAFIHAPSPENSVEMTPFSESIRFLIETDFAKRYPDVQVRVRGLKAKKSLSIPSCYDPISKYEAKCPDDTQQSGATKESVLIGSYRPIPGEKILLSYALQDINSHQTLDHQHLLIPISLLEDLRYQPLHAQFDQTLYESIEAHPDFYVELESSRGKRNILVYGGEDLGLKVKANTSAYYYLVGHVIRKNQRYSYLVDIGTESQPFVRSIAKQQVGQWVSLGDFTVEQPYGVEHLQLVASNQDLSDRLPETEWDPVNGYHVIKGSRTDKLLGLERVRGMQRLCSSTTTRGMQRNCAASIQVTQQDKDKTAKTENIQANVLKEHESRLSFTSVQPKNTN